MKNKREKTRIRAGITIILAIAFLFGALLPLFGATQASEIDNFASGNSSKNMFVEPSTNLTSTGSAYTTPFGIGAGNVYGLVN